MGCSWSAHTPEDNCDYMASLVSELRKGGKNIGVETNLLSWSSIFGNKCKLGSPSLPLWNINIDKTPNLLVGFVPFGGWTYQGKKMYSNFGLCGINIGASVEY